MFCNERRLLHCFDRTDCFHIPAPVGYFAVIMLKAAAAVSAIFDWIQDRVFPQDLLLQCGRTSNRCSSSLDQSPVPLLVVSTIIIAVRRDEKLVQHGFLDESRTHCFLSKIEIGS